MFIVLSVCVCVGAGVVLGYPDSWFWVSLTVGLCVCVKVCIFESFVVLDLLVVLSPFFVYVYTCLCIYIYIYMCVCVCVCVCVYL